MTQKILNEEQMRKYVDQNVRVALIQEEIEKNLDRRLDESFLGSLAGRIGNWIKDRLQDAFGENSRIGSFVREHANLGDLFNLAVGAFGIGTVAVWICRAIGIDMSSPFARLLVRAICGFLVMKFGDRAQEAAAGHGGPSSPEGGDGFSGGDENGGTR